MRTLKKTLALVLSVALAVSLLAVGASAAPVTVPTFSDATSITYKEAVDVMSTIGVFNGMDTGAFNPQTNLTREQAAKIICYLTIGKTAADGLKTSSDPFTDVSATRWSAGSIAYCVQQGYVAGRGDGTFDPTANVTGYEFAKMLLTALGYDASIEQFTGASWSINVAKRAFANKLFAGNSAFVGSAAATREQAALYALNTMQAGNVSYASKGTSVTVNGTVITTGATAPTQSGTFFGTYYSDLTLLPTGDTFGAAGNKWTYKGTVIGTYAKTADYTFTSAASGTTDAQKLAAAGLTGFTIAGGSLKVNGNVAGLADVKTAADIVNNVMANGRVVKLYVNSLNATQIDNVVAIDTSLAQITSINTAAQVVSLTINGGASLTVDATNKNYTALSAMKVNDYVLVTVAPDKTTVAAVATPKLVTGAISQLSNTSDGKALAALTVAGTSYGLSAKQTGVSALYNQTLTTSNSNVNLYLDSYGYAIYVNNVSTTTPYIWVLKLTSNVVNNCIVSMANGYGSDGTALALNVGLNTEDNSKNVSGDTKNHIVDTKPAIYTYAAATSAEANTYYSTNTLTAVPLLDVAANKTAGTYVTNATNPILAGATTLKGDAADKNLTDDIPYASNVKFIFCNPSDQTVTVLSGVQPVGKGNAMAVITTNATSGKPEIGVVYVNAAPSNATTSNILYLAAPTGTKVVGTTNYYTFNAVINGVVTPIFEKNGDDANKFYTYAVDATTGAYTLALYKPADQSINNAAVDQVVATSAAPYLLNTTATQNYNATKATFVDLTGTNLYTSLANVQDAIKTNTVTVAVVYDNLATDTNVNTISYVIVKSVVPTQFTITNSTPTVTPTGKDKTASYTVSLSSNTATAGSTVTATITVATKVAANTDTVSLAGTGLTNIGANVTFTSADAVGTSKTITFTMPAANVANLAVSAVNA